MTTVAPTGTAPDKLTLDSKYRTEQGTIYLTGIQALVRLLVEQRRADRRSGLHTAGLVSGYPGSPLGGVDLELERQREILTEYGIRHLPGLNEDLAATALWGSQTVGTLPEPQVDGVIGMWFGKAPGVDRCGDAFRTANLRGVAEHGGVIVVAGDDPDARSTNFPTDSNGALYDWNMPILFPADVQEVLDLGLHGYALSRASGLWVGMKMVTDVADGAGTAVCAPDRVEPVIPTVEVDGTPFTPSLRVNEIGAGLKPAERDLRYARTKLAEAYIRLNELNPVVVDPPDARFGLIAAGKAYADLRKAFTLLGLDDADLAAAGIRVKKVSALFPVADEEWREFANGLEEIIVVEEKRPFVERFLKEALYGGSSAPRVVGKTDERGPFLPGFGEFTGDIIARTLAPRMLDHWGLTQLAAKLETLNRPKRNLIPVSASRTPYFCSGCPHNRSLVVPEGSVVGVGIGCHIMELLVPRPEYGELSGFTQMGAEGAQWVGAAPFSGTPHIFQNVGDGTFHHSGSLALRFAVSSEANITFKLLYNSAVGMTGGQDVAGGMAVPELTQLLQAEGVTRTIVTTDDPKKYGRRELARGVEVWHHDRLVEAQEVLAATPGVTVLLHDQYCAAEKRRLRKRGKMAEPTVRVAINERVCEGCGDCSAKSQCLSVQPIETEFGRKTTIHQSSCNLDYSCLLGDCPSFVTVETKKARVKKTSMLAPPIDLPAPDPSSATDQYNVLMIGIGGTGVVTISQILATAATIMGRTVRVLDHTGASQKAGPVVSQLQLSGASTAPGSEIGPGEADLVLAFDLLGAMTEANLDKLTTGRSVVVGATSRVPTGAMAAHPEMPYPEMSQLQDELDARSRADHNLYFDAQALAMRVFGNHMYANMLLVGAASQSGVLPVDPDAVKEAIRLNGTAVDANLLAFEWGRAVASNPDVLVATPDQGMGTASVLPELPPGVAQAIDAAALTGEVGELVRARAADLVEYQNDRYATDYVRRVACVVAADRATGRAGLRVSLEYARGLHKFMAYKDEYEVARLLLDRAANEGLRAEFGEGIRVSWNLHPPVLRSLGLKRKLRLGPWFTPALRTLARLKWLRSTPLDVFGFARLRRIERALVDHYVAFVESMLPTLSDDRYDTCVAVTSLPELVRGYEDVKLHSLSEYRTRVEQLADVLGIPAGLEGVLRHE